MSSHPFAGGAILFVAIVAAIIGLIAWAFIAHGRKLARERAERMALAPTLGLAYEEHPGEDLVARFGFLDAMPSGHRRYCEHLFTGTYRGLDVRLFDYTWVTKSRDSKGRTQNHYHHAGVALALTGEAFPKLTIAPETWGHKLWDAIGGEDIDFESDEFSKKFWVKSDDKKFAYDVCHARTMEHLLKASYLHWEIQGGVLSTAIRGRIPIRVVKEMLDAVADFTELLPGYVRTTKAGRADLRPPDAQWKDGWHQAPEARPAQSPSRKG